MKLDNTSGYKLYYGGIEHCAAYLGKKLVWGKGTEYSDDPVDPTDPVETIYTNVYHNSNLTFDGSNYIDTGINIWGIEEGVTIFTYFTIPSTATVSSRAPASILHAMQEASPYKGLAIDYMYKYGRIAAVTTPTIVSTGNQPIAADKTSIAAQPVLVALSIDADRNIILKTYINGTLSSDTTGTMKNTSIVASDVTHNVILGAYVTTSGTYGRYFTGEIHDCEIYEGAMTADELAEQASKILNGEYYGVEEEEEDTPVSFKSLILYVGPSYQSYSDTFLQTVSSIPGMRLIIMSDVYLVVNWTWNGVNPAATFDMDLLSSARVGTATGVDDMKAAFNTKLSYTNYSAETDYVDYAVTLAKRIVSLNSSAKIWLSYPYIAYTCLSNIPAFTTMFEGIYDSFKDELADNSIWENNVEGMYYGTESIEYYECNFATYSGVGDNHDCAVVDEQITLRDYMNSDTETTNKKKFMWIPYLGYSDAIQQANNADRIAYVANTLDIFDYIILPSSYPVAGSDERRTKAYINFEVVKASVIANAVTDRDCIVSIAVDQDRKIATIGYQLEWDGTSTNQTYYETNVSEYTELASSLELYPTTFYLGAPMSGSSWNDTTMINTLKEYYGIE